jgi:cytochrome bd-type quinol oxidase subunit 2
MQLATRNQASVVPAVALITGVVAVSLAVASTLHLSGSVSGRAKPFDADAAGIAEAVIGVVLAVAALALWHSRERARALGLAALGFAIAGFCLGLSITSRGGHWPDIAYHASVLPVLAVAFVALQRAPAASGTTQTRGAPLTR